MSDIPRWNDVRADFSDAGRMFGAAQQGLSNAGTVFGQLRASILDQEQKQVDNTFREKQLLENTRQFGLNHTLERDKFGEVSRHNLVSEEDTDLNREQQLKVASMQHNAAMAGIGIQKQGLSLREKEYQDNLNRFNVQTQVANSLFAEAENHKKEMDKVRASIDSGTLNEEQTKEATNQLNILENIRKNNYTASELDKKYRMGVAQLGGGVIDKTPMTGEAANEAARTAAATQNKIESAKAYEQSFLKANEAVSKLNLGTEDSNAIMGALTKIQEKYPTLKPDIAASIVSSYYPTTGEILSGKNKFDVPISKKDYLVNFDVQDQENPIALRIAQAAKDTNNFLEGKKGTVGKSSTPTPTPTPTDYSNLTDEALDYREKQLVGALQPTVTNADIENTYKNLYVKKYGDMPKDEVPKERLEALKREAEALAETNLQNSKKQAVSGIVKEKQRRAFNEMLINSIGF